jgi:hypothetical protein
VRQRLHVHGIRLDDPVFVRSGDHWVHVEDPSHARRLLGGAPAPALVVPSDLEPTPSRRSLRDALACGAWWATLDPRSCTGRRAQRTDTTAFLYALPEPQRLAALLSLADGAYLSADPTAMLRDRLDDQLRAELVAALYAWSQAYASSTGRPVFWGRAHDGELDVPRVGRADEAEQAARTIRDRYVVGARMAPRSATEQCAALTGLWLWAGGELRGVLPRRVAKAAKLARKGAVAGEASDTRVRGELLEVLSVLFSVESETRYTPKVETLAVASHRDGRLQLEDPVRSALGSGVARVPRKHLGSLGGDRRSSLLPGAPVEALDTGWCTADGDRILSVALAERVPAWLTFDAMLGGGGWTEAAVTKAVPGGLRLSAEGLEVFLPASLVGDDLAESVPDDLVGTELQVAPVTLHARTLGVVVSRREALKRIRKAEAAEARKDAFARLRVGQRFDTTVSGWVNFGVFVDLDGVDGLCHVSLLGGHTPETLPPGSPVTVTVTHLDPELERATLALAS